MLNKLIIFVRNTIRTLLSKIMNRYNISSGITVNFIKNNLLPKNLEKCDLSSIVPENKIGALGIKINLSEQIKRLASWKNYEKQFKSIRNDPLINLQFMGKDYLHNSYYPTPDAEIYCSMILDYQPEQIIEIGAGFSTLIARKTTEGNQINCKIKVIYPNPQTKIIDFVDECVIDTIENVSLDSIINSDYKKQFLFIDSSHISVAGGDIPYIYNSLIPSMPSGTVVQIHDIFIPYDYPYKYYQRLYSEQYVLICSFKLLNKVQSNIFNTLYGKKKNS